MGPGSQPSLVGQLLISKPAVHGDSFSGTIIFLLEHDEGGAIGVILNRPSKLLLADAFADWESFAPEGEPIFSGGPVGGGGMIALADGSFADSALGDNALDERSPSDGSSNDGDLPLGLRGIDLDDQVPLVRAAGVERVRVFSGYAGWAPGQIEGELVAGAWWLLEATKEDVFNPDPSTVWSSVVGRGSTEMAWFVHYPQDPSLN